MCGLKTPSPTQPFRNLPDEAAPPPPPPLHGQVGALTGALANLPVAVCGGAPSLNKLYWPWFCK
jgi:hypothetical protein